MAYTWSKTLNFADNDGGPRIAYLPEKQRNRGPAAYDRTHNLQSYAVYDLPFGKGQRWAKDGWESKIFGGFQVSGLMSIMSGLPFYVVQNTAPNLLARGSQQVPNQVNPDIRILGGIGTPGQRGSSGGPWFDNTVLGGPAIFGITCTSNCSWALENGARFGSGGRNNLRGPSFFETDLTIYRTHRGIVMWRAFVYDMKPGYDRAGAAYENLQPFDGKFAPNVLLQVKNGPIDFQPREPFHPLFGGHAAHASDAGVADHSGVSWFLESFCFSRVNVA